MRFGKYLAAALACAALIGCGGGGSAPPNDPGASAGVWSGASTDDRQLLAFLLGDGTYWVIYSEAGDTGFIGGMAQGTATSIGTEFRSADGIDMSLERGNFSPISLDGTFTPGRTFSGNLRHADSGFDFITTFVDTLPSHLDNIAGNFSGQVGAIDGVEDIDFTVSHAGVISGVTSGGCTFSGLAAPRTDVGVFNVTLAFGGGACALGTSTVAGVAYLDDVTGGLFVAALNAARTAGFIAAAGRTS